MSDDDETQSGEMKSGDVSPQRKSTWLTLGPALTACAIISAAVVIAAYRLGGTVTALEVDKMSGARVTELTGGAAMDIFGAVINIGLAAIGVVTTLGATMIAMAVSTLGVVLGTVVAVGFVTGPLLLVGVVAVLIKRKYWPDVI